MPSKSRKKMKGQARKAKAKAAAAVYPEQRNVGRTSTSHPFSMICNHGGQTFGNILPDVCNKFIKHYIERFGYKQHVAFNASMIALTSACNKYPEVIMNDAYREIVKKSLISSGVSYFLDLHDEMCSTVGEFDMNNEGGYNFPIPVGFAAVSMVIDSFGPSSPVPPGHLDDRDPKVWLRNLDIINGCKRSLVKYYVNQIPCNCLDEVYYKIKSTMPKMGMCSNCKQTKDRKSMLTCTGCERIQFCSKACQLAVVPLHKYSCKFWQEHYG